MKKSLLFGICLVILNACSNQEQADFSHAQSEQKNQNFRTAISYYEKVVKRNATREVALEAAKEAAKLSYFETKDFDKALEFNKAVLYLSKNKAELLNAQKQISTILFDNMQDYNRSIEEINKFIHLDNGNEEFNVFRLKLARANYYVGKFAQSQSEIDEVVKRSKDSQTAFSAQILRANIFVAQKHFEKAIEVYKRLIEIFPDKSANENVVLSLAVCYEELLKYNEAIEVLEKYKNTSTQSDYIELRIKRIKERQKNAPGAKGFRK